MNSLSFLRIQYKFIFSANSLWIHFLFRQFDITNTLFFRVFNKNLIWIGYFSRIYYVFIFFYAYSLSISRIYHQFTICFELYYKLSFCFANLLPSISWVRSEFIFRFAYLLWIRYFFANLLSCSHKNYLCRA